MIVGIGTDIIEISRIQKAKERTHTFVDHVLTNEEKKLLTNSKRDVERLAAQFAAKEAVSKALGTGFRSFSMLDIEILRDKQGKPYVQFYGEAKACAEKLGVKTSHISLSHCKAYAVAMVILETKE